MTDTTSTTEAPKKRGKGAGKAGPTVVLSGSNMGPFTVEDEPPKRRRGRPSEYTAERGAKICHELAKGRSLLSILRDDGMPERITLVNWLAANANFYAEYAHARDVGWDVFAEKIVERATDVPPELSQSRTLEVNTGKWLLSKLAARKYGDRIEVKNELSGPNGGPLQIMSLQALLVPEVLERLGEDQIEALRSAIALLAAPVTAANGTASAAGAGPTIDGNVRTG
jgi:hypothetical protein